MYSVHHGGLFRLSANVAKWIRRAKARRATSSPAPWIWCTLLIIFTEGYRSGHNEAVLKTVWEQSHVGSNPTPSARKRQASTETCRFQLYSPYGELYAPSVRDICFASDMPAGVRGEYNITETVGFNITFCVAKYITKNYRLGESSNSFAKCR